jgi:hypothetical protein
MGHRFQKILTISSVILFILAFLLDVSAFGQHWNSFWESVDVRNIAAIIGIVIAFGLLLGLFFFRKKTYKQRLSGHFPLPLFFFRLPTLQKLLLVITDLTMNTIISLPIGTLKEEKFKSLKWVYSCLTQTLAGRNSKLADITLLSNRINFVL